MTFFSRRGMSRYQEGWSLTKHAMIKVTASWLPLRRGSPQGIHQPKTIENLRLGDGNDGNYPRSTEQGWFCTSHMH